MTNSYVFLPIFPRTNRYIRIEKTLLNIGVASVGTIH